MQGAILRKKGIIGEINAEGFRGDAVCVFSTDGIFTNGAFYGEKGVFYKNSDQERLEFYMTAAEILNKWIYKIMGREAFILFRKDMLSKVVDYDGE